MLTLLGILLIIVVIISFVTKKLAAPAEERNQKVREYNAKQDELVKEGKKTWPEYKEESSPFVLKLPVANWIVLVAAVVIFALNGVFFWANAGTAYAVQYPWGGDKMIATQGLKVKAWGRTIPLSYEISLKDIILRGEEKLPEDSEGIYNRAATQWEFSDAIKARIAIAVVVGVSIDDEEKFLLMADRNRSEGKLISGRVLPNIDAALKNTCKLMDAQEYISGKSSDFDRYFRDQLEHGMYQVEEYFDESNTPEIIGDTSTVRQINLTARKSAKQKRYKIKRDDQGNIIRDTDSNTLTQYGITIYQAQVTSIDWEASFDKRLDLQKDEVAKTQLEKQEAERQFYTAKKEVAAGEAAKARERATLEKEQIKLTIAAETEAKVAVANVVAEKQKLEVARLQAQSTKVLADAIFYENAKRVQAGLTPQERAKLELDKATAIANAFSKMATPQTVIMGGSGTGAGNNTTEILIQAAMAKQLIKSNQEK